MNYLSFKEVQDILSKTAHPKNILLGNGFSQEIAPGKFAYSTLYEAASPHLTSTAKAMFEQLGTHNFEAVLRTLQSAVFSFELCEAVYRNQIAPTVKKGVSDDMATVREALVKAIQANHPSWQAVSDRFPEWVAVLNKFENVFTTNYDLILYWIKMSDPILTETLDDGFRRPVGPSNDIHFHTFPNRGLYFLHGALHLYRPSRLGTLIKEHARAKDYKVKDLSTLIRERISNGDIPLFVAEGDGLKKELFIQQDDYLRKCHEHFRDISGTLVTYGISFENDEHLLKAIASNRYLSKIYIGMYDPNKLNFFLDLKKRIDALHTKVLTTNLNIDIFHTDSRYPLRKAG